MMRQPRIRVGLFLAALIAWGVCDATARAQLPIARLFSVFPTGGKQGTSVEVVITGSDLEDVQQLYFDHAGIKSEPVTEMKDGKAVPVPNKFKITIDANAPLGMHDVRAVGRYGISNPRTFVVGDLNEVVETEPNNTREQATRIMTSGPGNVTVNGQINGATDTDCYVFAGKAGQRILADCAAQRIDSRLDGRLALYGPTGRLLAASDDFHGKDPFLDVTLPADGDYTVVLTDKVYDGSPEYVYRLSIGTLPYIDFCLPPAAAPGTTAGFTLFGRNLPGGQPAPGVMVDGRPLEQLAVQIPVPADPLAQQRLSYSGAIPAPESTEDAFEYRLNTPLGATNPVRIGITTLPVIAGIEPNESPDKAQPVTPPCEVYGQFLTARDVDWYGFTAKANQLWVFEVISQRNGFPTDPFLLLRRGKDGAEIASADDDAANPAGNRFSTKNDDPIFQSPALAEGDYQVSVRNLYGAARGSARYVYRLKVRPPQPDFRLVAMHNAPAIPNVAQPPDSLLVRQGGNQHLDIYAIRRDGFNAEITVQAQALPAGVTCPAVTIGAGQAYVPLVFSAADNAAPGIGTVSITGTASIAGQPVMREARPAVITWAYDPNVPMPAQARLARSIPIAVREGAPYRMVAAPEKVTISRGLPLKLKLQLTRRGDFKDQVTALVPVALPPNVQNVQPATIAANQSEIEVTVNLPPNVPTGNYTIALRGNAPAVPFTKDPEGKNKQNVQVGDISTAVIVTVTDPLGMAVKPAPGVVKKGARAEFQVTLTRLGSFAGPVQLQFLQLPSNVASPQLTVPAEASEGKLTVTAAANAANGSFTNVIVRAIAQVNGQAINIDTPFTLNVE